jgi:CheY-like chemotaxis protein
MESDRHIHLILVEDDEVDVLSVKRALHKNNIQHSLHVASNGSEALSFLQQGSLSKSNELYHNYLIWLDLNMPKMGGIEFLKILRSDENLKYIPVIIFTTFNKDQERIEAYNLNVAGYIIKPFSFLNFVKIIETLDSYWTSCELP